MSAAKGWRWVFWVLACFAGALTISMLVLMKESYAPVILKRKCQKLRKATGNNNLRSKLDNGLPPADHFKRALIRPTKLLVMSPIVLIFALYSAILYGYLCTLSPGQFRRRLLTCFGRFALRFNHRSIPRDLSFFY